MAITKSTFPAIQFACNILENSVHNWFRTGLPTPDVGTTALRSYNAYRSFAWFDSSSISSTLEGERVISCAITMTSERNEKESLEPVPVRLYRTDLLYDASKTGWTSANTLRPDDGMTYENPYNSHFIEYAETDNLSWGGALTESVFVTGEQAQRLASALSSGYALGAWSLKSGTSMQPSDRPYRCRYLKDVSITIIHEPESLDVTQPTEASLSSVVATVGGSVTMNWSGATKPTSGNDITGYTIQMSNRKTGSSEWSAYSTLQTVSTTETYGSASVAAANRGYDRKFRIRTDGTISNSDWFELDTFLTTISAPSSPVVTYDLDGTLAKFDVHVSAGEYTTSLFVYCGGQCIGMLPVSGGSIVYAVPVSTGENTLSFTVRDDYGGVSTARTVTFTATRKNYGKNWCSFKGIRSEDVGCIVSRFMYVNLPEERLTAQNIIGVSGDVQSSEGNSIYNAYDATFNLLTTDDADIGLISEWLSGEGDLIFGDDPSAIYDARIIQQVKFKRKTERHENYIITIKAHIQPFKRRSDEDEILIAHSGSCVYNGGSVPCMPVISIVGSGDATVTINGASITVVGCDGSAIIDVKNKAVVHQDGRLYENVIGDFPVIPVGLVPVYYTGCTGLYIKRNQLWR